MIKESILGFPIYRFYYNKKKVKYIEKELSKLNYKPNPNNMMWDGVKDDGSGINLHSLPQFKELFLWFQKCLDEVKQDLNLTCDRLKIVSSWANLNKPTQYFHTHIHPNCFISSNYYASGWEKDKTIFFVDNPYFVNSNLHPFGEKQHLVSLTHAESTEPGKYVVFPPAIRHYATRNSYDKDRITIAANIYPEGTISAGGVSNMKIKIEE